MNKQIWDFLEENNIKTSCYRSLRLYFNDTDTRADAEKEYYIPVGWYDEEKGEGFKKFAETLEHISNNFDEDKFIKQMLGFSKREGIWGDGDYVYDNVDYLRKYEQIKNSSESITKLKETITELYSKIESAPNERTQINMIDNALKSIPGLDARAFYGSYGEILCEVNYAGKTLWQNNWWNHPGPSLKDAKAILDVLDDACDKYDPWRETFNYFNRGEWHTFPNLSLEDVQRGIEPAKERLRVLSDKAQVKLQELKVEEVIELLDEIKQQYNPEFISHWEKEQCWVDIQEIISNTKSLAELEVCRDVIGDKLEPIYNVRDLDEAIKMEHEECEELMSQNKTQNRNKGIDPR